MSPVIRQWVAFRAVAPIIIGGAVAKATHGHPFFDVFGPLAWTLFTVHLLCTFSFKKTHVLDTGAFFILIFLCGAIASLNSRGYPYSVRTLTGPSIVYFLYLLVSYIGIKRASVNSDPAKSIGFAHVVAALSFLLMAVFVCGGSKTAVGFLFVPGMLVVPAILLYSLIRPTRSRKTGS